MHTHLNNFVVGIPREPKSTKVAQKYDTGNWPQPNNWIAF